MNMKCHLIVGISIAVAHIACAQQPDYSISNITDIVGVDLNCSTMSNLPYRASNSPSDTFLGFLRSLLEASPEDMAFHLSPEFLSQINAIETSGSIRQSFISEFCETSVDTNIVVESCQVIQTAQTLLRLAVTLRETTAFETHSDTFPCDIIYTNGGWKIDNMLPYDER